MYKQNSFDQSPIKNETSLNDLMGQQLITDNDEEIRKQWYGDSNA